ncbi:MAG TPA: hypothetical protein VIJ29_01695 [Candidatus Paceibacterota bacterium]
MTRLDKQKALRLRLQGKTYTDIQKELTPIGIPKDNFTKTHVGLSRSSMGKRPFDRLPHGVIQIRINSTDLFYKVMGWIEGIKINL